jgi:arylsulfatase A-like enzyme
MTFWQFDTRKLKSPKPYIDPALQEGTTPLVKKDEKGRATRDFLNYQYPVINAADYVGPRAIIEGDHKLVIREKQEETSIELFNLKADPAEKTNLIDQQPELARKLQTDLRDWQESVLKSLTGSDYPTGK